MYLKFIKNHVSGIAKGNCIKTTDEHGARLIKTKFAEEVEEEDYNDYVGGIKKASQEKVNAAHSNDDDEELDRMIEEEEKKGSEDSKKKVKG